MTNMNPYLKNASEAQEFNKIVDIALRLFSQRKKRRQMAEKDLLTLGAKSVRPLAYTIELALCDHDMFDDGFNERAEDVSEIILQIGKDALPDLEYLSNNGSCNFVVNEWAQETIFKVMGLDGDEKQKVCHHFGCLLIPEEDSNLRICPLCHSKFTAGQESEYGDE
jgi:Zn finger protein HypA/HybF involved in hydrogenase expression